MGGTDPDNFLNSVGKNADGTGNGDILIWKRKGEQYLVKSGLSYTIIHPGGLTDEPAGREEFVLDVSTILGCSTRRLYFGCLLLVVVAQYQTPSSNHALRSSS